MGTEEYLHSIGLVRAQRVKNDVTQCGYFLCLMDDLPHFRQRGKRWMKKGNTDIKD